MRLKRQKWKGKKNQKKCYRGAAKTVTIFSGEFLSISTGHSCRAGLQTAVSWAKNREDLKQVIKLGSIWNQTLKILVRVQTQKKNVHLYCKCKSLQWIDTSLGKWATPLFCELWGHSAVVPLGKLKFVHVIYFLNMSSKEDS